MDMIESLAKQASQITMYDVKSYYNQAKNMVLNLSETEAKVREATNDDPWSVCFVLKGSKLMDRGASSTLMQEIADGTHNFSQFNEIMPTIYARFMEKEAREWRQIYKALTLLEFLVKNGSERVVDDARAHISTIKMLRSFHYIDEKGKDQGINVRNRSSEIALLLSDVEKIRQERRKAKANKQKYQGTGNDGGMSFRTAAGSRYGGFGSETLGGGGGGEGGSSRYTGGGGGYEQDDYRPSRTSSRAAAPEYDEYEGADDFDEEPRQPRRAPSSSSNRKPNPPPKNEPKPKAKEVEKPKEVNLFDFDDEPISAPAAAPVAPAAAAPVAGFGGDDDFDDFQSGPSSAVPSFNATPATTSPAPPKPASNSNLFDLLNSSTPSVPAPAPQQQYQPSPSYTQAQQPPRYGQAPVAQPTSASRPNYYSSSSTTSAPSVTSPAASKPASASTFDDLWASSLSSIGKPNPNAGQNGPKKSINDLEKEKAMNGLWGAAPASGQSSFGGQNASKSNNDDLLF